MIILEEMKHSSHRVYIVVLKVIDD